MKGHSRPDLGRGDVGRSLPVVYGTVWSLGVAVRTRYLTRTHSGRDIDTEGTELGDLLIESLRRIRWQKGYSMVRNIVWLNKGWRTNAAALGFRAGGVCRPLVRSGLLTGPL